MKLDSIYISTYPIERGVILGIDFGLKRIGLAISDPDHNIATPMLCLDNTGIKQTIIALDALRLQYSFQYILIGWPLNMNGTEGHQCVLVHNFCMKLYEHYSLPIIKWDERLSSRHTQHINQPKKGKHIDHIVAAGLLQEYLLYLQYKKTCLYNNADF